MLINFSILIQYRHSIKGSRGDVSTDTSATSNLKTYVETIFHGNPTKNMGHLKFPSSSSDRTRYVQNINGEYSIDDWKQNGAKPGDVFSLPIGFNDSHLAEALGGGM